MAEKLKISPENRKKLNAFDKEPLGFLVIAGPNGTGKTHVSKIILHRHTPFTLPCFDSERAMFITQDDLNQEWISTIKQFGETSGLKEKYFHTKLLVLDDVGTKPPTEAFQSFLYTLIDYRWNNRSTLGTIINTNLNALEMREKLGEPIFSRVASGVCMKFEGKDHRWNKNAF